MRWLLLACCVAACGGSPANVAGSYTVAITNGMNGCGFQNWTVGAQSTNIGVTVAQGDPDPSAATADVTGLTGSYLDAVLGSHTYTGSVDGNELRLKLYGTRSYTSGNCAYTINSSLAATLTGDALAGSIAYTSSTNGSPDCATIQGCTSTQQFNGTRPPTATP
jgi:hypothetical protein